MTDLNRRWADHLQTVRWFGGKGAAAVVSSLLPLPWYTAPGAVPAVRSEIATLDYPDGHTEHYHLLVAYRPGAASGPLGTADVDGLGACAVSDATDDPEALAAFVAAVAEGVLPPGAATSVKVWAGEQSNTTLVVGDDVLLKLFRKVEPGPNLDAEVLEALAGNEAPELFGRLVADWPAGTATDLGMSIARVPGAQDGWEAATKACAAGVDFSDAAFALGRSLKAVHGRLADAFGTATHSGDELADAMVRRLDAAASEFGELADYRDALASAFDAVRGQQVAVQRVHGDFHLGQTLTSPTGWTIIDFEGEPAKTVAERREFDSVWRDVAGMLRSFDYARSAHAEPTSSEATRWAEAARAAFLTGYAGDNATRPELVAAYETDKAVYEVTYELRNRPDWVAIPMRAIHHYAGASGSLPADEKE